MRQQNIFLSYARLDGSAFALQVATDLRTSGLNVWIDQQGIEGGESYHDAIGKALDEATHVLFVVSEKSIASKFVLTEVYYALGEDKVVIPLIIHNTKLPFRLSGLQQINFLNDYQDGFNKLMRSLQLEKIAPGKSNTTEIERTTPKKIEEENSEEKMWRHCQETNSVVDFEAYLERYPDGQFVHEAIGKVERLRQVEHSSSTPTIAKTVDEFISKNDKADRAGYATEGSLNTVEEKFKSSEFTHSLEGESAPSTSSWFNKEKGLFLIFIAAVFAGLLFYVYRNADKTENNGPAINNFSDSNTNKVQDTGRTGAQNPPQDLGQSTSAESIEEPNATSRSNSSASFNTEASNESVFQRVEVSANVNTTEWRKHLEKELSPYLANASTNGMRSGVYTVAVRFVVEKDGSVSDVKAVNDPGYGLADGAVAVLKKGPKWTAGQQNGKKVRSYFTQPITFAIQEQ